MKFRNFLGKERLFKVNCSRWCKNSDESSFEKVGFSITLIMRSFVLWPWPWWISFLLSLSLSLSSFRTFYVTFVQLREQERRDHRSVWLSSDCFRNQMMSPLVWAESEWNQLHISSIDPTCFKSIRSSSVEQVNIDRSWWRHWTWKRWEIWWNHRLMSPKNERKLFLESLCRWTMLWYFSRTCCSTWSIETKKTEDFIMTFRFVIICWWMKKCRGKKWRAQEEG